MTDQQIQHYLRETLPPPPLGDDASVEAMLDAHVDVGGDPAYGQGMLARARQREPSPEPPLRRLQSIAAILVLLAIPVAIVSIARLAPDRSGREDIAGGKSDRRVTPNPIGDPSGTLVEIPLEFPEPAFLGTPLDIKLPNLEPAASPRLSFTAPEGVHLISHGAMVTSSEPAPFIGGLAMVTDGQKLGDDSHFVELPPGHQWVQIDLGRQRNIYTIALWHYHKVMRAYRDVVIEASPDASFSSGSTVLFNNDHDNSLGLGAGDDPAYIETNHGRIIDVGGVTARYVRLHSNGNTSDELNHYTEVEVWGQ